MNGQRYVARDTSGRADRRCQHAVWDTLRKKTSWRYHRQGGMMAPFLGPDDEYERLTADGLHLWGK